MKDYYAQKQAKIMEKTSRKLPTEVLLTIRENLNYVDQENLPGFGYKRKIHSWGEDETWFISNKDGVENEKKMIDINKKKPKVFRRNFGIVGTFDWSNNVNLEEIEKV